MSGATIEEARDVTAVLQATVRSRVGGRIHGLEVLLRHEGLVLRGRAASYYAKQLAQHALMQATGQPIAANEIEVV
jgi:hypothetical protein